MEPRKFRCPYCGTAECRTSHIRFWDIPRLAVLKLPVRCAVCLERFYVGYRTSLWLLGQQRLRAFKAMEDRIGAARQIDDTGRSRHGMIDTK